MSTKYIGNNVEVITRQTIEFNHHRPTRATIERDGAGELGPVTLRLDTSTGIACGPLSLNRAQAAELKTLLDAVEKEYANDLNGPPRAGDRVEWRVRSFPVERGIVTRVEDNMVWVRFDGRDYDENDEARHFAVLERAKVAA